MKGRRRMVIQSINQMSCHFSSHITTISSRGYPAVGDCLARL